MAKLSIEQVNSIAKDMKYEALYWTLGYEETDRDIFVKEYANNLRSIIYSNKQILDYGNKISIVNGYGIALNSHKSFVVLECIDKLLSMGYKPEEIIVDLDNEYDIYCSNLYIKCYEWGHTEKDEIEIKNEKILSITYSSRLMSGVIERNYSIKNSYGEYNKGIFENDKRQSIYKLYNATIIQDNDFEIEAGVVTKYLGHSKIVKIPDGVTELGTALFWDNQEIEEVILPNTLINLSGDTFYKCSNLKFVNIPNSVKYMGNNPFAGCPNISINNQSPYFHFEDGALYNGNYTRLIYYSISNKNEQYKIKDGTKIVGKHAFFLCNNLKELEIPQSVIKLENNPFSGCEQLEIINYSNNYKIIDKVIYDKYMTSVIGCLNSIKIDELKLPNIERINRNSFWNCKGIQKIVLPNTLKTIGYNPFVDCSNIEFESNSENYVVYNNALYTKNKDKLICYPAKFAVGEVYLPDETITLERGAFSGCNKLQKINLHNVSIISKTCFTNCDVLESVYCSDLVAYIGEWAFAHCKNLKNLSIYKDCRIDKNVTMNTNVKVEIRQTRDNYVIESDNIYTLKSMVNSYENKIKAILIDPPYNSKIDYINYKDNFENDYLDFMDKRLDLSYKLLSNDGFLIINIDEGEVKNLEKLCKKYFYSVNIHKWEKLHPYFDINRNVVLGKKDVLYEYIIICKKSKDLKFNKIYQPYIENNKIKEKISNIPKIFSCFGTNSSAKDEIAKIFCDRTYFSTPKPLKLIKELIRATTNKDSLVLDFFAGSGTTGHATIELNNEDGGSRHYILISNNESNICQQVTLERMKKFDKDVKFIN